VSILYHRWLLESAQAHVATVVPAFLLGVDGASKGNIKQHQRWVMGLFFGALLINGLNNVFLLPGITHDVFFGR
jgi:uncharacterized membrane protein